MPCLVRSAVFVALFSAISVAVGFSLFECFCSWNRIPVWAVTMFPRTLLTSKSALCLFLLLKPVIAEDNQLFRCPVLSCFKWETEVDKLPNLIWPSVHVSRKTITSEMPFILPLAWVQRWGEKVGVKFCLGFASKLLKEQEKPVLTVWCMDFKFQGNQDWFEFPGNRQGLLAKDCLNCWEAARHS